MHPLAAKIGSLQRRILLQRRLVAACSIVATILATALVLGLADYTFRFADRGLRLMTTAALIGVAAWVAYRWWLVPRRQRLSPLTIARRVEARFPELHDSLASAVEFLEQSETDLTAGSPTLRRLVVTEAENATQNLPLDEVIDRRPLRRAAGWLGLATVIAVILVAIDASAVGTALARLTAPLGRTEWPRQNHLAFRDPPTRLAAGQTFEVELIDTQGNLPDNVRIEYRLVADGRRTTLREPMMRIGDEMVARRENVRQPFAFRAVGGDDQGMRWHHVEVVDPTKLESLMLVVHPPAYTGVPATPAERHLDVLAGSHIEVTGTASEPLGAARVLLTGGKSIAATIGTEERDSLRQRFHIAPNQWVAAESGSYRLELEDAGGVAGVVGQWNLRVTSDPPPSILWQRPTDDLYVTTQAVVPIELLVQDNLAVERVELVYERVEEPAADQTRVELYRGAPPDTPGDDKARTSKTGETRVVEHAWDLDALRLPSGAQLLVRAEATDYRPGTGQTASPRRITIVTAAELETRLTDRLASIVRHLERALATQRTTREDVRRLEIQQRDAGTLTDDDRNSLQTAELAQRRVGHLLTDKMEGAVGLAAAIVEELDISRVRSPDTRRAMGELNSSLDRLAAAPLSTAERELTAARKSADTSQAERLTNALITAGAAQDEILSELERLLNELSSWADYGRFARELAELRNEQLAHAKTTGDEIGVETIPLEPHELTRAQRAGINKAAAGEAAIAARFEKIGAGMAALADELANEDPAAAGVLRDAVSRIADLAIAGNMQAAARHLEENRVGRAIELEEEIAGDLQQVLDVLQSRSERDAERLVDQLAKAEQRLAALREQLAALRAQIAKIEQQAAGANTDQRQKLAGQQQSLAGQIAQLARELERIAADAASQSVQQAADRLSDQMTVAKQNAAAGQPSQNNRFRQAEQKLADAARQLAERRAEAEQDLALEFVRRFHAELDAMLERQRRVVQDTAALDAEQTSAAQITLTQSGRLQQLAGDERDMATTAREQSELLSGLAAIRLSLEETAGRLDAAAELLDAGDTGAPTQQFEVEALQRLEGMAEAFAQTAAESQATQAAGEANEAGGEPGDQPGRRPTFELLEVKVLRMLQVDLNERTRQLQDRLAEAQPDSEARAQLDQQAEELAAQQGRLAKLVEEMQNRDNE